MSARRLRLTGRRRVAAALVLVGLLGLEAVPAQAGGGSFSDREVVQLSHAGLVRGSGGLDLHLTARDDVQASNAAVATTQCDDCRATAVSFQVVVADRGPASIGADNLAYAANVGCARCESTAVAYQFVVAYQSDVLLTVAGRRRLQDIDAALRKLARAGTSDTDVQAAADGYAAQVLDVLASEVRIRPTLRKDVRHVGGPGRAGSPAA